MCTLDNLKVLNTNLTGFHRFLLVFTEFFSGPYFYAFGLNTPYLSVFSPNAGKYGPEEIPHLDTFHAVFSFRQNFSFDIRQFWAN